jgi:hypothetical protein
MRRRPIIILPTDRNLQGWRRRRGVTRAVVTIIAMVASVLTFMASQVSAADGDHVSYTLEGCNLKLPTIYDPDNNVLVCDDGEYTTGNLGAWAELDLVPHRFTASATNAAPDTQTYSVYLVADHEDAGKPGYDYMSEPVVNTALSDSGCEISVGAMETVALSGGTDLSIARKVTFIGQDKGTECVIDYYQRLAVGSHLFPGSSLHSNKRDSNLGSLGEADVPLPVNLIEFQELDKDMTATQGASHTWNVTKEASPAELDFADTCLDTTDARSAEVEITIEWDRLDADPNGDVTIVTNIYATNPAHRTFGVSVTDDIRSGTTVLESVDFGPVDVGPGDTELIGTHTLEIDAAAAVDLNDIATGTYTDPITNFPIDETTEAVASATVQTSNDPADNDTATITDVESITGDDLSFSVDGFTPNVGDYDGGYVEGTETTSNVSWTSDELSADGSVTFTKTVYVDGPSQTSGTLSDTATLTGSDGFTTDADADVDITADAIVTLEIEKTISQILDENVTFTFNVTGPNSLDEDVDVTIVAGDTTTTVDVGDALGIDLEPGEYTVTEQDPGSPWAYDDTAHVVDLSLPTCDATETFTNSFGPASAKAVKVTDPAGEEEGWEMCLFEDDVELECVETDANGDALFEFADFAEGSDYDIRETGQDGWDNTDSSGDCSFTVDYPTDADREFVCTFENTQRGTVTVLKTSSGSPAGAGDFCFQVREDASATEAGTTLDEDCTDAAGEVDFDELTDGLEPGDYQLCEIDMMPGWETSLSDDPASFVPDSDDPNHDNSILCVPFTLDAGEDESFSVDNTPPPGGDARTIGFWRNWSSCSGGNQDDVLDQTLASAPGGGILIGDLFVNTCAEAVNILSKSDLNGTKRASDPAFNLAAQLLAAFLNVEADAGVCPAATTAMSDAQTLLANADFDGYRTFGGSSSKGKKGTAPTGTIDASQANTLAGTLDDYNNNELC